MWKNSARERDDGDERYMHTTLRGLTKRLDICYISICHTLLESQTDSINVQVHRHYHHHNQLFVFFMILSFLAIKDAIFS